MLHTLKIENIAVIENASIEFKPGLNVLTGETGAGKSIIIDSINAVIGERTSKDLIRTGYNSGHVSAVFTDTSEEIKSILESFGVDTFDDNTVTISRFITSSGKNTCKINGWPVTVTQLKSVGNLLINIHGQHDSQDLLSPEKHCGFIDKLADNEKIRSEYKTVFHSLISTKKELDSLYDTRDEKISRLDYLNFVIDEIQSSGIREGETEELNKEKEILQNGAKIKKSLDRAYNLLSADNGIVDSVNECSAELTKVSAFLKSSEKVSDSVREMSIELSDVSSALRDICTGFDYSESRMTDINDRLDVIYRLSMKYGKTDADILKTLENALKEKGDIQVSDDKIASLEKDLYDLSDKVKKLASSLTESRKKAACKFEKMVSEELAFLDMPYVKFVVDINKCPLSSRGAENIEFLISVNPGQEPKTIAKIASGGELSRIMLAIKNVLSGADNVDTLIFDEIDTGVSGSAAEKIALKLYEVSKGRQVICVTHLARIAAQADNHLKILKNTDGVSTSTEVIPLDFERRAEELARINAGSDISDLQIDSAKEMINKARSSVI